MTNQIAGIDPGLKGGICIMRPDGHPVRAYTMPVTQNRVSVRVLHGILVHNSVGLAIIEEQQVRGGQRGNLTIGANLGRIYATLEFCRVAYKLVKPQEWQKFIGVDNLKGQKKDTKQAAINFCTEKGYSLPKTSKRSNARIHDGIADAFCIAAYGVHRYVSLVRKET